jgi:fumarate hydratase class II
MPGKVNPVMAESLMQVAAQVVGNDAAISAGASLANFQLFGAGPLVARNLLEQIQLLQAGARAFEEKLVKALGVDEAHIADGVERSLAMATALVPHIGYDRAAEIAKRAEAENKTVRQVARELELLPEEVLEAALDPGRQVRRHAPLQ